MFSIRELESLCFVFVVNFSNLCVFSGKIKIKTLREEALRIWLKRLFLQFHILKDSGKCPGLAWQTSVSWRKLLTLTFSSSHKTGFLWRAGFFYGEQDFYFYWGNKKEGGGQNWGIYIKFSITSSSGGKKLRILFRYYFILILTVFFKNYFSWSLKWWICHKANKAETSGPIAWINLFLVNSHLILHCFS